MGLRAAGDTSWLLGADDVAPVHEVNAAGRSPFLLTCDHFGRILRAVSATSGCPRAS